MYGQFVCVRLCMGMSCQHAIRVIVATRRVTANACGSWRRLCSRHYVSTQVDPEPGRDARRLVIPNSLLRKWLVARREAMRVGS